MKYKLLAIMALTLLSCCKVKEVPLSKTSSIKTTNFNILSEKFLQTSIEGEDTQRYQDTLAKVSVKELQQELASDSQRYAFWINIYNAYILEILKAYPEYYDDRSDFFSRQQLTIAGEKISFEKIEHGVLRKSQWSKGLGYIRKWFPDSFERKLRVEKRDYRIHFALNCGAKDCPPVAIYTPKRLEEQWNKGTQLFLKKTSELQPNGEVVKITPLFSWFRGDFGGKNGTKKILADFGIIPNTDNIELEYKNYDWTLSLDNFTEL